MENIRGITVKNTREIDKYSISFKRLGMENSVVGSTFDIDESVDSIVINNRETLIGFTFTPMDNTVNGNAIDIFLTTDLLKNKNAYTIASVLIQLVGICNTPENRIVDIGVYIINEKDFISLSVSSYLESRQIFSVVGFLEYVKILLDKDMIYNTKTDGISYFSALDNTEDLNIFLEELLTGETLINNIE